MRFRSLGAFRLRTGESPLWDDRRGLVFFVDIEDRKLHSVSLDGQVSRSWTMPDRPAALAATASGILLVALGRDLVLFDPDTARLTPFARVEQRDGFRLNDGKVGADGAFWVGSLSLDAARPAVGVLYRIDPSGGVAEKVPALRTPNGLAWSADGRTMYLADSRAGFIDTFAFDPATGTFSGRRRLCEVKADEPGRPDGGACDAEGGYWSAWVFGDSLKRFLPDGAVAVFPFPVANPTMPCFCGDGLSTMVVTALSPDPQAGARLFVAPSPVPGAAVPRFEV